jgi:hypothetical protein
MSRDWVPAGSVPFHHALANDGQNVPRHVAYIDGSVARQAVLPYKGPSTPPKRNPKFCQGNNNTCNGFKAKNTSFCIGHLKSIAKSLVLCGGLADVA